MKRILIVDDEVDLSNIATEALRGEGLTVVHNGLQALALTLNNPFDLLLTRFDEFIDADEAALEGRLKREFQARLLRDVANGTMGRC